jgi:hypothetical protein
MGRRGGGRRGMESGRWLAGRRAGRGWAGTTVGGGWEGFNLGEKKGCCCCCSLPIPRSLALAHISMPSLVLSSASSSATLPRLMYCRTFHASPNMRHAFRAICCACLHASPMAHQPPTHHNGTCGRGTPGTRPPHRRHCHVQSTRAQRSDAQTSLQGQSCNFNLVKRRGLNCRRGPQVACDLVCRPRVSS